jgi:hypothetical protein
MKFYNKTNPNILLSLLLFCSRLQNFNPSVDRIDRRFMCLDFVRAIIFPLLISPKSAAHSPQPTAHSPQIALEKSVRTRDSSRKRFCFSTSPLE